jgi:hypothetical protein
MLAILGLVFGPLARPANAMPGPEIASATSAATTDATGAMEDMPCCPDEGSDKFDCQKDCPLMALCMTTTMQNISASSACLIQFGAASVIFPGNERNLESLFQSPPAKPPKA